MDCQTALVKLQADSAGPVPLDDHVREVTHSRLVAMTAAAETGLQVPPSAWVGSSSAMCTACRHVAVTFSLVAPRYQHLSSAASRLHQWQAEPHHAHMLEDDEGSARSLWKAYNV